MLKEDGIRPFTSKETGADAPFPRKSLAPQKHPWTFHEGTDASTDIGGVRSLTFGDLGVVFQPIVDVATGKTFAHEALVRCRRPEYKSPIVLFERAVEEKATGRLGRLIRDVAFSTSGEVSLFVNLHPEELSSRWLVRPDDPIGFHSQPVFLEVTEAAAFTHFDLCMGVLKELCLRTNARLVVDDFGAGHSNLQRVVDLEPAIVKLDLALTRDVHKHKRKQSVVRHMVNLCAELGAQVVAEGVEVLDELTCVRDLGVQYAQGYLLARPAEPPPPVAWPFAAPAPALKKLPFRRVEAAPPTPSPSKRPAPRASKKPGARTSKKPPKAERLSEKPTSRPSR
jgi:EAL domain-containing protein (putative c-di-GMP-specific phosphodiesterase class I)